jgi:small subunit ribosomal protein S20
MATHKSAEKRNRQAEVRKEQNHYFAKSTRSALKKLRDTKDKKTAADLLPKVSAMLDKLAKKKVIHKNKASNLKSGLAMHVKALK